MSDHNMFSKLINKTLILYVFLLIAFLIKIFNAGKFKGESKSQTAVPPAKSNFTYQLVLKTSNIFILCTCTCGPAHLILRIKTKIFPYHHVMLCHLTVDENFAK